MKIFFAAWAEDEKGAEGFGDLKDCIEKLSEQDGKKLRQHVSKGFPTIGEFCSNWTDDRTHVLCGSLYVDLREWLGAGKWRRLVS